MTERGWWRFNAMTLNTSVPQARGDCLGRHTHGLAAQLRPVSPIPVANRQQLT
jgi:hypothetical protein